MPCHASHTAAALASRAVLCHRPQAAARAIAVCVDRSSRRRQPAAAAAQPATSQPAQAQATAGSRKQASTHPHRLYQAKLVGMRTATKLLTGAIGMRAAAKVLTGAMLLSTVPHPTEAARRAPDDKDSAIRGAMMGSLVADALTLGTHYEYDAEKIERFYGGLDRYYAPGEKTGGQTHGVGWGARNFHGGNGNGPPKRAGEQTDYGDYNILVLGARRTCEPFGPGLTL
jgi:hypothetical protein